MEMQSARTCKGKVSKARKIRRLYLLPKRKRKEQESQGVEDEFKRIFWKVMKKNNWKPEELAAKETKEE